MSGPFDVILSRVAPPLKAAPTGRYELTMTGSAVEIDDLGTLRFGFEQQRPVAMAWVTFVA